MSTTWIREEQEQIEAIVRKIRRQWWLDVKVVKVEYR